MRKLALLAAVSALAAVTFAQGDHVPAYNQGPPKPGDVLPILPPDQRVGELFKESYQLRAYVLAAKIPGVLNQLPCYCYCERIGHKSLHTCFESDHGAHCGICMKEVFCAYQQTKLNKTPAQIRAGIVNGEWKAIDLNSATHTD